MKHVILHHGLQTCINSNRTTTCTTSVHRKADLTKNCFNFERAPGGHNILEHNNIWLFKYCGVLNGRTYCIVRCVLSTSQSIIVKAISYTVGFHVSLGMTCRKLVSTALHNPTRNILEICSETYLIICFTRSGDSVTLGNIRNMNTISYSYYGFRLYFVFLFEFIISRPQCLGNVSEE